MIKFFRKIRQNLLSENRFSKYLFYAVGEIILVVIGILIALAINNNNERKKSEAKVLMVFEEVLQELESNIKNVIDAGMVYKEKDSLAFLVLNTNLSRTDYKNNLNSFFLVVAEIRPMNFLDHAYNKLIEMTDAIPSEYDQVMKELYELNKKKKYVDLLDNKVTDLTDDIITHQTYNNSWAIKYNPEELLDYIYNDIKYKQDLKMIVDFAVNEHYEHATYYLDGAITVYKEIATMLNKTIDYELLGFNPEIAKSLTGNWTSEQYPGLKVEIYIEDHQLLAKVNNYIHKLYFISDFKLYDTSNSQFFTIVNNENELNVLGNIFTLTKTKV